MKKCVSLVFFVLLSVQSATAQDSLYDFLKNMDSFLEDVHSNSSGSSSSDFQTNEMDQFENDSSAPDSVYDSYAPATQHNHGQFKFISNVSGPLTLSQGRTELELTPQIIGIGGNYVFPSNLGLGLTLQNLKAKESELEMETNTLSMDLGYSWYSRSIPLTVFGGAGLLLMNTLEVTLSGANSETVSNESSGELDDMLFFIGVGYVLQKWEFLLEYRQTSFNYAYDISFIGNDVDFGAELTSFVFGAGTKY
ncbi:MAG: hypothetical protein HQM11_04640 [SAR324 cluster bacterium]|nr:hypothetical protein [SAR324 cluster bacterium]